MTTVPIHWLDLSRQLVINGLIRYEGDHLCLEFQVDESALDPVVARIKCPHCEEPVEVRRSQVQSSAVGPPNPQIAAPASGRGIQQVRIPRADVASVVIESGLFGLVNRLVIQLARLEPVKDVPGIKQGRLVLSVSRRDRAAAEAFVADLNDLKPRISGDGIVVRP